MANEKRLIDANAMREDWLENGENEYVYDANAVLDSIDAQPTVDAVEVVRCRDCKKGHSELAPNGGVWCAKWNHVFGDDGYCSYGGRKDND